MSTTIEPIVFCRVANLEHHQVLIRLNEDEETGCYGLQLIFWAEAGEITLEIKRTNDDLSNAQHLLMWMDDEKIKKYINGMSETMGLSEPYELTA